MAVIHPETLHEDKSMDLLMDAVPLVLSSGELRDKIRKALWCWYNFTDPKERAQFFLNLKIKKERQRTRSSTTKEGGCIPGEIPEIVDRIMREVTQDPLWIFHNKRAIGILFDEFPEGRFAHWEGRGEGPSRITLTDADVRRYA